MLLHAAEESAPVFADSRMFCVCRYGIAWSTLVEGRLLSGSDDKVVCVWDTNGHVGKGGTVEPLRKLEYHTSVVEDVAWHR
jgi:histone-binding protein RBBP4